MSERLKILGLFVVLGFIAGILANFGYNLIAPVIMTSFPQVLRADWILSGVAGAILTLLVVVVWAYLSGRSESRTS